MEQMITNTVIPLYLLLGISALVLVPSAFLFRSGWHAGGFRRYYTLFVALLLAVPLIWFLTESEFNIGSILNSIFTFAIYWGLVIVFATITFKFINSLIKRLSKVKVVS